MESFEVPNQAAQAVVAMLAACAPAFYRILTARASLKRPVLVTQMYVVTSHSPSEGSTPRVSFSLHRPRKRHPTFFFRAQTWTAPMPDPVAACGSRLHPSIVTTCPFRSARSINIRVSSSVAVAGATVTSTTEPWTVDPPAPRLRRAGPVEPWISNDSRYVPRYPAPATHVTIPRSRSIPTPTGNPRASPLTMRAPPTTPGICNSIRPHHGEHPGRIHLDPQSSANGLKLMDHQIRVLPRPATSSLVRTLKAARAAELSQTNRITRRLKRALCMCFPAGAPHGHRTRT